MSPLKPMSEFDPSRAVAVHDQLNDAMIPWSQSYTASFREHAHDEGGGIVEWDGHLLDGWR